MADHYSAMQVCKCTKSVTSPSHTEYCRKCRQSGPILHAFLISCVQPPPSLKPYCRHFRPSLGGKNSDETIINSTNSHSPRLAYAFLAFPVPPFSSPRLSLQFLDQLLVHPLVFWEAHGDNKLGRSERKRGRRRARFEAHPFAPHARHVISAWIRGLLQALVWSCKGIRWYVLPSDIQVNEMLQIPRKPELKFEQPKQNVIRLATTN